MRNPFGVTRVDFSASLLSARMMKRSKTGQANDNWLTREITFKELLPAWSGREWLGALILVVAVCVVYLPVWKAGFVWDDRAYITNNPHLQRLDGLKEIWTSSVADISPFTFTTFWLEHALWGSSPRPYHVVNVLQHGLCAVLLWRVLVALKAPGAWLGAALWALHPVEVESVAWVSEMKNTESGVFFLLAILFFVRWLRRSDADGPATARWNYALTFLFAALAMATKSSTVILPVVLGLVAWWIEGRWSWRNLGRVAPIFMLSVVASALSLWTQAIALSTELDPQFARTWPERIVTAGVAVWFYLGKLLWPHPVMTLYPRWQIDAANASSYLPVLAVVVTLVILWIRRDSWARAPFFVFAYFLVALLPVLGLFNNYIFRYSLVFDHFQYLASMGPMALAGAGLARLADTVIPGKSSLRAGLCAGLLLVLAFLTWPRVKTFHGERTLWADTVAKNPACWSAHYNLALALMNDGHLKDAETHFRKTLELYPSSAEAHLNLGLAVMDQGRLDEALAEFHQALKYNSYSGQAYNDIGDVLLKRGKTDEAMIEFEKAELVDPSQAPPIYNYGQILFEKGKLDAAIAEFRKAVADDPGLAPVHYDLGRAYAKKGQVDAAIAEFQWYLGLEPTNGDAYENLGLALAQKGDLGDAVAQYEKALEINPKAASVQSNMGVALFQSGQKQEAMIHLRRAIELDPKSDQANNNLGNALLAGGQVDDAITQYQKALAINAKFADARRNLGLALLLKGRAVEAIAQLQAVVQQNPADRVSQDLLAKAQAMARQNSAPK